MSILNGGCIRSDSCVPKGTVTIKTISTFFPFEDVVMFLKLSGASLLYCLENGVSRAPAQDGRFCHVSGIRFKYDPSKPEKRRVVEALVSDRVRFIFFIINKMLKIGCMESPHPPCPLSHIHTLSRFAR